MRAAPPAAPVRGGDGEPARRPLEGFADLHLHQMTHLGFGGSVVWGGAFGPPGEALGPIPALMKAGHDRCEALFDGDIAGRPDRAGQPRRERLPDLQRLAQP